MTKLMGILGLLLAFSTSVISQNTDTITMNNGREFPCKVLTKDEFRIDFVTFNKKGKAKPGFMENYRVFSYKDTTGKETVVYREDSLIGNFFTESEMHNFVLGGKDAREKYKPIWWGIGGGLLGFGATIMDTYVSKKQAAKALEDNPNSTLKSGLFRTSPSYLPFIVPIAYTLVIGIPRFRVPKKRVNHTELLADPQFRYGYQRIARQRRIFTALGSTSAGILLGWITHLIFKK